MLETKTVLTTYPFILAVFTTRKEGLTREQFQTHQETIYVPLLQRTSGKTHPLAWSRRYHIGADECPTGVPHQLIGTMEGLDWDCAGEMTFADELHFQQFVAWMHSEGAEAILEEEENFCDTALTKVIVMRRGVTLGERAEVQKLDA